jgi:hypothetical protein
MEEGIKPKKAKNTRTTQAGSSPNRSGHKPYFIFGCVSLLFIVVTLLFKDQLSPDQQFFFKILFALGCAGVAAAIPGITTLKYKGIVSASGAIAVFVLILSLNPPKKKFSLTIFPKHPSGDMLDLAGAKMSMQLNQGLLEGVSTSENTIKFNDVPNDYFGDSMRFSISAGSWVFNNGYRNIMLKLDNESVDLYFKRDPAFLTIGGTLYHQNAPLAGAVISDSGNPSLIDTTDNYGSFKITFPESETRTRVRFNLTKNQTIFPPLEINMGNSSYETNFQ